MTELAKYEAAERALSEADSVDEVLEIRSQAEAWRAYAKQAKNRDLEIKAARIRFRAERRLGEMLLAQKETVGLNQGRAGAGRPRLGDSDTEQPKTDDRPTLAEAGIDRKLSSRAQRVAEMDRAEFEAALARHAEEMRGGQGRVAMDLLKVGAEEKGRERRRDLARVLSDASAELPSGRQFAAAYIDCPWSRKAGIGDRAYENHYPTMTWPEILKFLRSARELLLPDSWAFFWIPRAHLLAPVETEIEVTVSATGEVVLARVEVPLSFACQLALGMDSYSTCFVWTKTDADMPDDRGLGLIAWDQDELLLLFKRGAGLPKPAGSEKFGSNHRERPREHSRKPDFYRHMIATMTGGLPVLELFARVDAEHPLPEGWEACGNQAGAAEPAQLEGRVAAEPFVQHGMPETQGPIDDRCVLDQVDPYIGRCVRGSSSHCDSPDECAARGDCKIFPFAPARPVELDEFTALRAISNFAFPNRAEILPAIAPAYIAQGLAFRIEHRNDWILSEPGWSRFRALEAERRELAKNGAAAGDAYATERAPPPAADHPALTDAATHAPGEVIQQVDVSSETADPAVPSAGRPGSNFVEVFKATLTDDEFIEWQGLVAVRDGDAVEPELARGLIGCGYAVVLLEAKLALTEAGQKWLRSIEQFVERSARLNGDSVGVELVREARQVDLEEVIAEAPAAGPLPLDLPLFLAARENAQ
ncbi:hypothetical protein FFI89_018795 [Bradyrhizobium sp. KBS0727]|uniref:hypothetical protein n=1 Tax=unclassified Bradyrhizobium TaxID=2631580 RepID=UPI00110EBE2C|nr:MULTISPECIES: hypothetical protein [unclassified Bradyrhizobium]QDW39014.1 hypothetical protein FFI71_018795 [Bradyrhizobium sp. KBS0725]QDW45617.1 hypothetical protein FFI89_018795 [Bradyrhizobium sp. KBS0727]